MAPLRLAAFRRLLATYAINGLGDWLGEIALAVAVYAHTRSALAVAVLWLVQHGLGGAAAPLLVARAERIPVRRVLPALYAVQAGVFLALALLPLSPALVLPLVALDGVAAPLARSLSRAAVVAVTQPAGLHREGNATLNLVFTINCAAGPALGGLLVATLGASAALLLNSASFIAAAALLGVRAGLADPAPEIPSGGLREAIAYVRARPDLRRMLAAVTLAVALLASIVPIEIVFVTDTLGAGESAYGALLTAWGAGMVAGGAIAARMIGRALGPLLVVGRVAVGVAYAGMGLSTSVVAVAAWSAIGGAGNGAYGLAFITALQERTAASFQTRVSGLYEAIVTVAPAVGYLTGGVVTGIAGPRPVYVIAGAGALAILAWALVAERSRALAAAPA